MSNDIKWMDLNEFLNDGFLQEANRRFFHPLGLALAVTCDEDGKATGLTGLWDYRDDLEGMLFGEETGDSLEKANLVDEEWQRHANYRQKTFGWVIQPVDEHGEKG